MRKYVGFLCFFLLGMFHIRAQGYRLSIYQTEHGLPTNLAKAVIQDQQGFIWVATEEGITRFDGNTFINIRRQLPSNYVRSFFQTRSGKLLAVTDLGIVELSRLQRPLMADSIVIKPFLRGHTRPDSAQVYYPKSVYEDCQGNLWISEYNAVVRYRNGQIKRYVFPDKYHSQDFSRSFSFVEPDCKKMIVSSHRGSLFKYMAAQDSFQLIETSALPLSRINCILKTSTNKIWIGDNNGIFQLEFNSSLEVSEFQQISTLTAVSALSEDAQGNIFAGTWFNGLYLISFSEGKPAAKKTDTFFFKVVNSIYVDKEQSIWTSCDEGIALLQPTFMKKLPLEQITPYIESIFYTPEHELLVAEGTHIHSVRKQSGEYRHSIAYTYDAAILSLLRRNDTLFVGTNNLPPLHFLHGKNKIKHMDLGVFDRSVFSMTLDREQNIWVTQYNPIGVVSKITPELKIRHYKSSEGIFSRIHVVRQAPDGNIYCGGEGTTTYLYKYDKARDRFNYLNLSLPFQAVANFTVNDLCFDNEGKMWLASNQGLMIMEKDTLRLIDLGEKFSHENIKAVLPGKNGGIWVGTNFGLIEYYHNQYFLFEETSGLPTKTITARGLVEDEDETLWVATAGGLAYSQIRASEMRNTPRPLLLSLRVNGQAHILSEDQPAFAYHSYFQADFTSLTYPGDKILYQYRITGLYNHWSAPSQENRLFIPQLGTGDYMLEVRAKQQGNYEWSEPLNWKFRVKNAWYRTFWAAMIYLLSAIGLVTIILKLNTKRLRTQKERLERLIAQRTQEIRNQRDELDRQKKEIEKQNQEIKSSIVYSKRIQDAMLPDMRSIMAALPETFIFYQPRDIVSGDFYWFAEKNNCCLIAVADCTGHGVPGALMSMIGHDKLHQIINEKNTTEPGVILYELNQAIITSLRRESEEFTSDGLDIVLLSVDRQQQKVTYAGAKNPLYYFAHTRLCEIKGAKFSIGEQHQTDASSFPAHSFSYQDETCMIYLFTDGFRDQFGGNRDVKYTSKRFKNLLQQIHCLPVAEQESIIKTEFTRWKGNSEQTDDVLVIGIRL